jgi:hypothetical protein
MVNINLKELAEHLALEECKRIYGDEHETLYKNNYDYFVGYVMRPAVKVTFNKMYDKYYDMITTLINKKDNEI